MSDIRDKFLTGNFDLSNRALNCCRNAGIFTLGDLIDNAKRNNIVKIKNCGVKTRGELQALVHRYADFGSDFAYNLFSLPDESDAPHSVTVAEPSDPFVSKLDNLSKARIKYVRFTPQQKALVDIEYNRIFETLSRRAKNALNRMRFDMPQLLNLVLDTNDRRYLGYNCGVATLREIRDKFRDLYPEIERIHGMSQANVNITETKSRFAFLTDTEVKHVADFRIRRSYLPVYYLVWKYFSTATDRDSDIYARYYGYKGAPVSFYAMSKTLSLSEERQRQVVKNFEMPSWINDLIIENRRHYHIGGLHFINPADIRDRVINEEFPYADVNSGMVNLHSFACTLTLLARGKVVKFDNTPYFISRRLSDAFDVKGAFKHLRDRFAAKRINDESVPVAKLTGAFIREPFAGIEDALGDLVSTIAVNTLSAKVMPGRIVVLPQNVVILETEIVKILDEYGRPLKLLEIRDIMARRFPQRDFSKVESLRSSILMSPRIKAIGKTSTYGLIEWSHINPLTIRDQISLILSDSPRPMKTREIVDALNSAGKASNINNVHSSIYTDTKHGFVKFKGGFYGLSTKTYDEEYEQIDMRRAKV